MNKFTGLFTALLAGIMLLTAFPATASEQMEENNETAVAEMTEVDVQPQEENDNAEGELQEDDIQLLEETVILPQVTAPIFAYKCVGQDVSIAKLFDGSTQTFFDAHLAANSGFWMDLGNPVKISNVQIKARAWHENYTESMGYLEVRGTNDPNAVFSDMTLLGRLPSPAECKKRGADYVWNLSSATTNEKTGELNQLADDSVFRYIMIGRTAEYTALNPATQVGEISVGIREEEIIALPKLTAMGSADTGISLMLTVSVKNQHPTDTKSYVPVVASYDSEGNLLKIAMSLYELPAGASTDCMCNIALDSNAERITTTVLRSLADARMLIDTVEFSPSEFLQ